MSVASKVVENAEWLASDVHLSVFSDNRRASFAIGRFDFESLMEKSYGLGIAYFRFRTNVYRSLGIYSLSDCPDGFDIDSDDRRSEHFLAVENIESASRLVGTLRLIHKSESRPEPLPVERLYGDAYFGDGVRTWSIEVSRLIVGHENPKLKSVIEAGLFNSAVAWADHIGVSEVFSVVEPFLEARLNQLGLATNRVTHSRYIKKYNTRNFGLKIDYSGLSERLGAEAMRSLSRANEDFTYFDEDGNVLV